MQRVSALDFVFRHRSGIPLLLTAPIVIAASGRRPIDPTSALLGLGVVAAGVSLRLLAIRRIGRGARVHRAHASAGLITQGPYRWSRNPLYLAAALVLCGLGLVAGLGGWATLLLAATPLFYTPVVMAEERALAAQIGEPFRDYVASVPRWLGRPRARVPAEDAAGVPWREVFRRERWLVPGCLIAAGATLALRGGMLPLAALLEPLARATGCSLGQLLAAGFGIALAGNAIAVELHQRRRRARRTATS